MSRRSTVVRGYVKFPVNKPSSKEGGMFVRLVVYQTEKQYKKSPWTACCGGWHHVTYDECYLGSDKHKRKRVDYTKVTTREDFEKAYAKDHEYELVHFPNMGERPPKGEFDFNRYLSIPYLCTITLGSTGWSSGFFLCTYKDLTKEGKALYNNIKKLYPNCMVELQTWLDT